MRLDGGRTVPASLRGRLKQEPGSVVIGDRVSVAPAGDTWTIESVQPRATALVRRGRDGRKAKVLAANLDHVLAVVALADPPGGTELADRLLVLVEASGMRPVLVLNKVDLPGARATAETLTDLYEGIGYRVLRVSARSGEGIPELAAVLSGSISALIGPSGVGKSSLLNTLDPTLDLRTGALSGRTGTGRHTTVSSRVLELAGGALVADTPGFGDVALWGVSPGEVAHCFPEMAEPAESCRFRRCSHLHEPGCGVREALREGRIPPSRYDSYARLYAEASEAERR